MFWHDSQRLGAIGSTPNRPALPTRRAVEPSPVRTGSHPRPRRRQSRLPIPAAAGAHRFPARPTQYRCESVRQMSASPVTADDDVIRSPNSFAATTSNALPAFTTNVAPSLLANTLPSLATGMCQRCP